MLEIQSSPEADLRIKISDSQRRSALRKVASKLYSCAVTEIELRAIVEGLTYSPVAVASALVMLERVGACEIQSGVIRKTLRCNAILLANRKRFLNVGALPWKGQDTRRVEQGSFAIK